MKPTMKTTIKSLVLLGALAIALSFLVLGAGWLASVARLSDMKAHIFTDAQSLEHSYRLELAVRSGQSEEADNLALRLPDSITSPEERSLVQNVERDYQRWREGGLGASDALLESIREHRALNEQQMQATMEAGARLESTLLVASPLLIGLCALVLGAGGLKLWARIFDPLLKLSCAAEEFGKGAMWARAPVSHEDEVGELCRTFNGMADAIRDREHERLRFTATVVHDLKNPLATIGMASDLMCRREMPPESSHDWLCRIRRNARRMESIIADLTDGVQAQTGHLSLHLEPLDLAELCAEVVREQAESQDERDTEAPRHELRFEGDGPCPIRGDRRRLERVLVNLISNAVKYSPAGSEVRVSLWRRGLGVRLCVEDQGQGIAPQDLDRLFHPFTRLESTSGMAPGTGLGLFAAQKIIHAHGALIDVQSQVGHGTTIEILFPTLHVKPSASTCNGRKEGRGKIP
jgi:signal transduction histidine kinase